MRTGRIEANITTLDESFRLSYISELVARKREGTERSELADADITFHQAEYERLRAELGDAYQASTLPESPTGKAALSDLLVRLRLGEH